MEPFNLFESSSLFFKQQKIDNSLTNEILDLSNETNLFNAPTRNGGNETEENYGWRIENTKNFSSEFQQNKLCYMRNNEKLKADHAMSIELCLVKCPRCHRVSEKTELEKRNKLCSRNCTLESKRQVELSNRKFELAHYKDSNDKFCEFDIAKNVDQIENVLPTRQNNYYEKSNQCQCETDKVKTGFTEKNNKTELEEDLKKEHREEKIVEESSTWLAYTDKQPTTKIRQRRELSIAPSLTKHLPFHVDFDALGNVTFTEKNNKASKENTIMSLWFQSLVECATRECNTLLQERQNVLRALYCYQETLSTHNKKKAKIKFATSDITQRGEDNAFINKPLDEPNTRRRSPSPLPLAPSPHYKNNTDEICKNTCQTDINCYAENSGFIFKDKCFEHTSKGKNYVEHNGSESEHSPANRQCTVPPPEQAYNSSNNTYMTNVVTSKCESELHYSNINIKQKEKNMCVFNARYRKEPFVSCGLSSYVYTSPSADSIESIPGVTQSVELSTNNGLWNESNTNFKVAKRRIDRLTKAIMENQFEDNISENKLFCVNESVCLCNNPCKNVASKESCPEKRRILHTSHGNNQNEYCFDNGSDNNNNNSDNICGDNEEEENSKSCYTIAKKIHLDDREEIYECDGNSSHVLDSKLQVSKEDNQKFWTCVSMPVHSQSNEQSVFSLTNSVAMSAVAVKIAEELAQPNKKVNLQSKEWQQESTSEKATKMVTKTSPESRESLLLFPALTQELQSTDNNKLTLNVNRSFVHKTENYPAKVELVDSKGKNDNSFGNNFDCNDSLLNYSSSKMCEQWRLNDQCNAMERVTNDNLVNSISSLRKLRHFNEK